MLSSAPLRKIIHIDCDCFFAAVELRDNPVLRGHPVAVGGRAEERGVLATCNYEARQFGLHSAMATAEAVRRCPQLILLPPRFAAYKEAAQQVRDILQNYSVDVEPLSLDEAYLDVSCANNATAIAREIRQAIVREVGITASAGVSVNKFLAKVASDWRKPDGQFVIPPLQVADFVAALPVQRLPGVGTATLKKLQAMNIYHCADLQQLDMAYLISLFGVFGKRLYELARGIDTRPVCANRVRKSLSVEQTFASDLRHMDACVVPMQALVTSLEQRWRVIQNNYRINKVSVKVRFSDFSISQAEARCGQISTEIFVVLLKQILQKKALPVRLLGAGLGLDQEQQYQIPLFGGE